MKLIVIFGPSAVGKMTVGMELAKISGYKLFHNHMVIELLYHFYSFNDEHFYVLNQEIRNRLFEEFGKSDFKGIIFTYVWALDQESDHIELLGYINKMNIDIKDVIFVELEANQDERLRRNKTELRLREKQSKNNIKESEAFIYNSEKEYKLNSNNDFMYPDQHIKINNTKLDPQEVAKLIQNKIIEIEKNS